MPDGVRLKEAASAATESAVSPKVACAGDGDAPTTSNAKPMKAATGICDRIVNASLLCSKIC